MFVTATKFKVAAVTIEFASLSIILPVVAVKLTSCVVVIFAFWIMLVAVSWISPCDIISSWEASILSCVVVPNSSTIFTIICSTSSITKLFSSFINNPFELVIALIVVMLVSIVLVIVPIPFVSILNFEDIMSIFVSPLSKISPVLTKDTFAVPAFTEDNAILAPSSLMLLLFDVVDIPSIIVILFVANISIVFVSVLVVIFAFKVRS